MEKFKNKFKGGIQTASSKTVKGLKMTVSTVTNAADAITPDLVRFGRPQQDFPLLEDKELCRMLAEHEEKQRRRKVRQPQEVDDDSVDDEIDDQLEIPEEDLLMLERMLGNNDPNFDPIELMLDNLPDNVSDLDPSVFDVEERQHELLLDVVMKRLSTSVVKNYSAFGLPFIPLFSFSSNLIFSCCSGGIAAGPGIRGRCELIELHLQEGPAPLGPSGTGFGQNIRCGQIYRTRN